MIFLSVSTSVTNLARTVARNRLHQERPGILAARHRQSRQSPSRQAASTRGFEGDPKGGRVRASERRIFGLHEWGTRRRSVDLRIKMGNKERGALVWGHKVSEL